jgi:hypothetical protein
MAELDRQRVIDYIKSLSVIELVRFSRMLEPHLRGLVNSQFFDTPLPSAITEFAVQIMSNVEGRDNFACGTGVIVAPYLVLASRHVIEDHWERHQSKPMPLDGENETKFSLVLAQQVGNSLNVWAGTRMWGSPLSDIMLLSVAPYSEGANEYQFRHLTLDLLPPRVGEKIHAFGYTENEVVVEGPKQLTLKQRARTTHGEVVEVFYERRDSVKMPFPCFETNARFDGGMSGGPVFNDAGHLCGLICSSYPPFEPGDQHASYVVTLWPIMGMPIDLNREGHSKGLRYPVIDLVRDRILVALNAGCLTVGELPEEGTAEVTLRIPGDRLHEAEAQGATSAAEAPAHPDAPLSGDADRPGTD